MYKKGLDLFLALHLPKNWQYLQLTMIWWICVLIADVVIMKQFAFFLVFCFSLTFPWFFLTMHVSFVHCVIMLLYFSSFIWSTLCKTLCEKGTYVQNSLTQWWKIFCHTSPVLIVRCIRLRWMSFRYRCTFIFVLDLFVSLWRDVRPQLQCIYLYPLTNLD